MSEICRKCGFADYIHDAEITCDKSDLIEKLERQRTIEFLIRCGVIRRDALGDLVAMNTYGTEVIYLTGLESANGSPERVRTVVQDKGENE